MIDETRKIFFSPDDNTLDAFMNFMKSAKKQIRIADYSFNLIPLVDDLIQAHKNGIDVSLILDKTQAAGPSERPVVQELKDAGVPLVIGTSDMHKIMHDKYCIIDGELVEYGSWNMTLTATKESNFLITEHNPDVAKIFLSDWQKIHDWIIQHEPQ